VHPVALLVPDLQLDHDRGCLPIDGDGRKIAVCCRKITIAEGGNKVIDLIEKKRSGLMQKFATEAEGKGVDS
jgi:hypothetical protein